MLNTSVEFIRKNAIDRLDSALGMGMIVRGENRKYLKAIRQMVLELDDANILRFGEILSVVGNEYSSYLSFLPVKGGLPLTTPDIEGPFYKPHAPIRHDWKICKDPDILITGRITDPEGKSIGVEKFEVWQSDPEGKYDLEKYDYRATLLVDANGNYGIHTKMPGKYAISDKEFRCPHIHIRIPFQSRPFITQLYFPGGEYNEVDHWYDPTREIEATRKSGEYRFDFVLEKPR